MRTLFQPIRILCILLGTILGMQAAEPRPEQPLLGTWQLDVARTQQNRRELKKLPPGIDKAPKAEDIVSKTVIFNERGEMATVIKDRTAFYGFRVVQVEGSRFVVRYDPKSVGEPPVFTTWEILGPDEIVNYLVVFSLQEPLLADRTIATYYKRAK